MPQSVFSTNPVRFACSPSEKLPSEAKRAVPVKLAYASERTSRARGSSVLRRGNWSLTPMTASGSRRGEGRPGSCLTTKPAERHEDTFRGLLDAKPLASGQTELVSAIDCDRAAGWASDCVSAIDWDGSRVPGHDPRLLGRSRRPRRLLARTLTADDHHARRADGKRSAEQRRDGGSRALVGQRRHPHETPRPGLPTTSSRSAPAALDRDLRLAHPTHDHVSRRRHAIHSGAYVPN